jgi:hypothetical protein
MKMSVFAVPDSTERIFFRTTIEMEVVEHMKNICPKDYNKPCALVNYLNYGKI